MAKFKYSEPVRRKRIFCNKECPFPVPIASVSGQESHPDNWCYYTGHLVDKNVLVSHTGDMDFLYKMGFFGKGTLSRFGVEYNTGFWGKRLRGDGTSLRVMARRKYLRHLAWSQQNRGGNALDDGRQDLEIRPMPKRRKHDDEEEVISLPRSPDQMAESHPHEENIPTPESGDVIGQSKSNMDCDWPVSDPADDPWANEDKTSAEEFWGLPADKNYSEKDLENVRDSKQSMSTSDQLLPGNKDNITEKTKDLVTGNIPDELFDLNNKTCTSTLKRDSEIQKHTDSSDDKSEQTKSGATKESCASSSSAKDGDHTEHKNDAPSPRDVSVDSKQKSEGESSVQNLPDSGKHESDNKGEGDDLELDPLCQSEDEAGNLYVVDDSEASDTEPPEGVLSWQPVRKHDPYPLQEQLQLTLEEAFFLSYGLGCLVVLDEKQRPLNLTSMWREFSQRDANFVANYVVYHNMRAKGWVPKIGTKYGCQFVVYKEGPPFYHSSYCCIVRTVRQSDLCDITQDSLHSDSWLALAGLNRITEQVSKEVLVCFVIRPDSLTDEQLTSPKCIPQFKIQELIMRRWVSSQNREQQADEEEIS